MWHITLWKRLHKHDWLVLIINPPNSPICFAILLSPLLETSMKTLERQQTHDDVMKWKHFPRYWPFVRGIHRSPVARSSDVFFDLRLNKRLSKKSRGWRFETPSGPLWRHRNATSTPILWLRFTPNIKLAVVNWILEAYRYAFIVRRAGLLWSQQDFEWRWSVPLFKCLTVLEFSFILFNLCLLITFFNFIMNYVPIVTFWIFTYHKIWILSIMFCSIWSYWIIYFLACLEVSWRVVS